MRSTNERVEWVCLWDYGYVGWIWVAWQVMFTCGLISGVFFLPFFLFLQLSDLPFANAGTTAR
jgi:hypothetical protein